jgi:Tfp pilus assembly protein PilP
MTRVISSLVFMALVATALLVQPVGAQTPQPSTPPAAPAPAQPAAGQPAAQPQPATTAYAYQVEGRRDPFVSLLGRGMDPKATRAAGLPGMLINEISVKGILKSREGYSALVQGPDNRTYTMRSGDKLFDGSVKSITADAVIFSQDVNDPLSVVKQREVVKRVRSTEEGRQ